VSSKSVTLSWSFATRQDGVPQTRNRVWSKLSNGEASLSPYATWEVQLVHKQGNFSQPLLSQDQTSGMWLELNGQGSYITPNYISIDKLQRFYGPYMI
jgi:hypothetical protein